MGHFPRGSSRPLAAALLYLAGLLAGEVMSSVFPDLGVEENYIHTPTHGRLCMAVMEIGCSSNRSQWRLENARWRRLLCHCWSVEGSQAANETVVFLSPLLSTPMEGRCQLRRAWTPSALDGQVSSEEGHGGRPGGGRTMEGGNICGQVLGCPYLQNGAC